MHDQRIPATTDGERGGGAPAAGSRAERLLRLIHSLSTANRHLRRHLVEVAAARELSDSELFVVWLCRGAGWVQVELAGAIGVSPAQMSGIVDRLRSRGLIAMHRPTMDRRRQVWRTTEGGQELLGQVAPLLETLANTVASGFSDSDEQTIEALLQRLAEATATERGATTRSAPSAHEHEQRASKEAA